MLRHMFFCSDAVHTVSIRSQCASKNIFSWKRAEKPLPAGPRVQRAQGRQPAAPDAASCGFGSV